MSKTKFFYGIADVLEATEGVAHQALEEIAEETLLEWRGLVKRRVYEEGRLKADPNNDYYKRTNQLLDSLQLKWINPLEVVLYYNTEEILPSMMVDGNGFNRHTSFDGTDVSHLIPTFIEEGNGDSRIYAYEGVKAHEEIIDMLNRDFLNSLKIKIAHKLRT